jgi:hypothetical protein
MNPLTHEGKPVMQQQNQNHLWDYFFTALHLWDYFFTALHLWDYSNTALIQ